jgi:hypothetical protein
MNTTCQGTKRDGTPCSRNASEGSSHCWQHPNTGDQPPEFPVINDGRKEEMSNLTHFMRTNKEFPGFSIRVVTNMATPAEYGAHEVSRVTSGPEEIGNSGFFLQTIDIGDQTMPLFLHRAVELGIGFRFVAVPMDALRQNPEVADEWLARSNFSWANSSTACFIKFAGHDDWGLEPLGLTVNYSRKLAKRLNEVARVTRHEFYGPIVLREFLTPAGFDDRDFDGMNFISESFAARMGIVGFRGNIRILTPLGLIKGDFAVVPNENLDGADVVYHTDNMKEELITDGWYLTTCFMHDPSHELRHDDQSRGNFSHFITHDRVMADLKEMKEAFRISLEEDGELANYLVSSQKAYSDPIAVDYERFGTAQRVEEHVEMLKEIGIAPASFSNITFMRLNAIKNKMDAGRHMENDEPTQFFDRMSIPASNAMSGKVVTYEAMTMMGGVEFGQSDGTQTFLDQRYGVIMPGDRFIATYLLHGGWDLDDSVSVYKIKVFCTDPARTYQLMNSGVLDPALVIPVEESEAIEVGLMIRLPNGPGEYSIEGIDEGAFGYYHVNDATVEVVDLADAPYDVDTVFGQSLITGVPVSPPHPGEYTRQTAESVIGAQMINPGIGSFVNLLMSWSITFGVGTLPDKLIGRMEDVVDATEQTADPVSFAAISADITRLWGEFARKCVSTGTRVDRSLFATRIPFDLGKEHPIGEAIAKAGLLGSGRNTVLQREYEAAITFIGDLAKYAAAKARSETPLVARIKQERFGPLYLKAAKDLYFKSDRALRELDKEFRSAELSIGKNAILRRIHSNKRRMALEALMEKIVAGTLSRRNVDPHRLLLALYKYIITPDVKWENGRVDRIFVQPSPEGTPSMMHLFVEALEVNGVLIDIIDPI